MSEEIIYQDCNNMFSITLLYEVEGYYTYEVGVATLGVSGKCNFCISQNMRIECLKQVEFSLESLSGTVKLSDCDSDAYLEMYFADSMNFYVSGQIGGSYEDNSLKFMFKADQTLLQGLKRNM